MFMALFQHHPDNLIKIVDTSGRVYMDNTLNFALDSGETYPGLSAGYIERVYSPGKYHYLGTGSKSDPQPNPWNDGDRYIAMLPQLIIAKELRLNPPNEPKTPEQIRQEAIRQLTESYLSYIKELDGYLLAAIAEDDLQTQEDIKLERAAVKTDYFNELQTILSGYS